jgi:hypothetical protein
MTDFAENNATNASSNTTNADASTATTSAASAATSAASTQEPGLTIQDLQALKAIIDVASSRGAFRPNEMVAVGQTYTKLEQFLSSIATQNKE